MGCGSSKEPDSNEVPVPNRIQKPHDGASTSIPMAERLRSTSQNDRSAPGIWPKLIKIPGFPFTVHIHLHVIACHISGDALCWTYISQGLAAVNQREIAFSLVKRNNEHEESFPEAPIEWMRTVYLFANQGLILEPGQMCDLVFENSNSMHIRVNQFAIIQDAKKWAALRRFGILVHGIPWVNNLFLPPGALPRGAHHVIALTHEEAVVARQFGPTRVIGLIGRIIRWFPYPPYIDRDRADAVTMADQVGSIRIRVPIARIYGCNTMRVNEDELVFTIPDGEEKRNKFKKCVMDRDVDAPLGFESYMVAEADAYLTWKAGQRGSIACGPSR